MATLNMVLGAVETSDLGFTLSHEHVMSSSAGIRQTYPEFLDRASAIEKAVTDLKEAYYEGWSTLGWLIHLFPRHGNAHLLPYRVLLNPCYYLLSVCKSPSMSLRHLEISVFPQCYTPMR